MIDGIAIVWCQLRCTVCRIGFMKKIAVPLLVCASSAGNAAEHNAFTNPILRGAFPDPSICHVDDTYYIVNSSFEYFPGLPIHRSSDLVNWELAGYGLHRVEQVSGAVNLVDVQSDGGIHAPSIRCRDGRFYLITTNVYSPPDGGPTEFVNFVITAEDPAGPWSEPLVIDGAPGIDPDLFFDDDGRVWYVGTHSPDDPDFPGEGEIWLQELDAESFALKGDRYLLWRGACGGVWAEGPHLYKRDGRYYLMIAEGGTSFNHAVMIAVSDDVTGPYVSNDRNPILTSRHLSYDYWVNSIGHGDLVELPDGRWYMVTLGIRGDVNRRSNMGRETHLVPVIWEREPFEWKDERYVWPVVAPETGRVERRVSVPFAAAEQRAVNAFSDDFDTESLDLEWNFRRVPVAGSYSLGAAPGSLRLHAGPPPIRDRGRSSLLGIRQRESDFSYRTRMLFAPTEKGSRAGMLLFQKDDNYIGFTVARTHDGHYLQATVAQPGAPPRIVRERPLADYSGEIVLSVESDASGYRLSFALSEDDEAQPFIELPPDLILSRGYTGAYLGLYAEGGRDFADFDWVRYEGFPRE